MSAFICSDVHFATIAAAVFPQDPEYAQDFANKLKSINIDSFNTRYRETTRKTKCKLSGGMLLNSADVAGLIKCWIYQSSENPANIDFVVYAGFLKKWVKDNGAENSRSDYWSI